MAEKEIMMFEFPDAEALAGWDPNKERGVSSELLSQIGLFKLKLTEVKPHSKKNRETGAVTDSAVLIFAVSEKGPDLGKRIVRYIPIRGAKEDGTEYTGEALLTYLVKLGANVDTLRKMAGKKAPLDQLFKNYIGKETQGKIDAECGTTGKYAGRWNSTLAYLVKPEEYKDADAAGRLKDPLPDDAQAQYDKESGGKAAPAAPAKAAPTKGKAKAAPEPEPEAEAEPAATEDEFTV